MAYNVLLGSGLRQIIKGNTILTSGVADGGTGTSTDPYYKDVTISALTDINKTVASVKGFSGSDLYGSLTSTTNIRLYYTNNTAAYYDIIESY